MPRKKLTKVRSRLEAGILGGVAAAIAYTTISLVPRVTHMELGIGVIALGILGSWAVSWVCWHAWRQLFSTAS